MSDAKYGEPWRAVNNRDEKCIVNSEWKYIALDVAPKERDRIIACVNALAGYDPAKVAEVLRRALEWADQYENGGERERTDYHIANAATGEYEDACEDLLAAARQLKEQNDE